MKLNVAVLKKTVNGIEHKIKGEHVFAYARTMKGKASRKNWRVLSTG